MPDDHPVSASLEAFVGLLRQPIGVWLLHDKGVLDFFGDDAEWFAADGDHHALDTARELERRLVQIADGRFAVVAAAQPLATERPTKRHRLADFADANQW